MIFNIGKGELNFFHDLDDRFLRLHGFLVVCIVRGIVGHVVPNDLVAVLQHTVVHTHNRSQTIDGIFPPRVAAGIKLGPCLAVISHGTNIAVAVGEREVFILNSCFIDQVSHGGIFLHLHTHVGDPCTLVGFNGEGCGDIGIGNRRISAGGVVVPVIGRSAAHIGRGHFVCAEIIDVAQSVGSNQRAESLFGGVRIRGDVIGVTKSAVVGQSEGEQAVQRAGFVFDKALVSVGINAQCGQGHDHHGGGIGIRAGAVGIKGAVFFLGRGQESHSFVNGSFDRLVGIIIEGKTCDHIGGGLDAVAPFAPAAVLGLISQNGGDDGLLQFIGIIVPLIQGDQGVGRHPRTAGIGVHRLQSGYGADGSIAVGGIERLRICADGLQDQNSLGISGFACALGGDGGNGTVDIGLLGVFGGLISRIGIGILIGRHIHDGPFAGIFHISGGNVGEKGVDRNGIFGRFVRHRIHDFEPKIAEFIRGILTGHFDPAHGILCRGGDQSSIGHGEGGITQKGLIGHILRRALGGDSKRNRVGAVEGNFYTVFCEGNASGGNHLVNGELQGLGGLLQLVGGRVGSPQGTLLVRKVAHPQPGSLTVDGGFHGLGIGQRCLQRCPLSIRIVALIGGRGGSNPIGHCIAGIQECVIHLLPGSAGHVKAIAEGNHVPVADRIVAGTGSVRAAQGVGPAGVLKDIGDGVNAGGGTHVRKGLCAVCAELADLSDIGSVGVVDGQVDSLLSCPLLHDLSYGGAVIHGYLHAGRQSCHAVVSHVLRHYAGIHGYSDGCSCAFAYGSLGKGDSGEQSQYHGQHQKPGAKFFLHEKAS